MKILIFSDSHLHTRFDEQKFNFLTKRISEADKVIINGDFWDGYLITFDKFIKSPWNKLFPLLKSKKTVYIFGNHDKKKYADERVNLFSDEQTLQYILKWTNKILIIEHGDRLHRTLDHFIPLKYVNKVLTKIAHSETFFNVTKNMELSLRENNKMKKKMLEELSQDTIYICGHSHYPEDDQANNYINSGYVKHDKASYIVITDEAITLKKDIYSSK